MNSYKLNHDVTYDDIKNFNFPNQKIGVIIHIEMVYLKIYEVVLRKMIIISKKLLLEGYKKKLENI